MDIFDKIVSWFTPTKEGRKTIKITEEEYNKIVQELSERIKDFVFINAEKKIRQAISKKCMEDYMKSSDDTEITYSFTITVNNLYQILARLRRDKEEN